MERRKQLPMRRLNLEMPAGLCADIEEAAKKAGLKRAEYIRKALTEYVQRIYDPDVIVLNH